MSALLSLIACAVPESGLDRRDRLIEVVLESNSVWLAREPEQVAQKFEEMAGDPFDWFRGSSPWYWADLETPGADRLETRFLQSPETWQVMLVGDLHPENVGTFRPGVEPDGASAAGRTPETPEAVIDAAAQALVYGSLDLDGATRGPWTLDLRRAVTGMVLLAGRLEGCDDGCLEELVGRFALAYADEIRAQSEGAGWDGTAAGMRWEGGAILADLAWKAAAEGIATERLQEWSVVADGSRRFRSDGDDFMPLTDAEAAQVARLLAAWAAAPAGLRVQDARRRIGVGIASRPALRYTLLWDSGGEGTEDDRLLELREVLPPPEIPAPGAALRFDSNADRVRIAADELWPEDADALYTGIGDGGMTFKVYNPSSWFQHIDRDLVEEGWEQGRYAEADLLGLAQTTARLLALAHAGGRLPDGGPALPVIAADLDGDGDGLWEELQRGAAQDRAAVLHDHTLFAAALEDYGPLLGWAPPVELR